jgi:hypothetical protein
VNDRWRQQRPAINGETTVSDAAFRLDAGIAPPAGQDTDQNSRDWVRSIGRADDDAGHVIGHRFGGRNDVNSVDGNLFPQDLSFNRGTMRSFDREVALLHERGSDVCVHIVLEYASPTALRPVRTWYHFLYRSAGAKGFNQVIGPVQVPNR